MKFLSVIVFIVSLVWTWNLIHSIPKISFETHVGIHDNLAEYIETALSKKRPNAKEFQIHRLWTEENKDQSGNLTAHFTYSFSEEGDKTKTTIQGWAILEPVVKKEGQDLPPGARWIVKEVHPLSDAVVFEEGSVITAKDEPAATEPDSSSGEAKAATPPAESEKHEEPAHH